MHGYLDVLLDILLFLLMETSRYSKQLNREKKLTWRTADHKLEINQ